MKTPEDFAREIRAEHRNQFTACMFHLSDEQAAEAIRARDAQVRRVALKTIDRAVKDARADALREAADKFPTMLRKMWSGGEVQEWLKRMAAEQEGATDAAER